VKPAQRVFKPLKASATRSMSTFHSPLQPFPTLLDLHSSTGLASVISKDAPPRDGVSAIVGLGTIVILRGLVVDSSSTRVFAGSLVDWDCGVVGVATARLGTADKGVGVFEVEIDRDGL